MKKSFILYSDAYDSIKCLPQVEKGNLLDAIFQYAIEQRELPLEPVTKMAFSFIKSTLERDAQKWEGIRKQRRVAGSKGGKMRVANQANATFAKQIKQDQANQAVSANVSVNVNDNVIKKNAKNNSLKSPQDTSGNLEKETQAGFSPEKRKKIWDSVNSWSVEKMAQQRGSK